jgi:proteasome lid subunit RPN8/RPN11
VINELYGMQVVGWYHSHPSFPALPSVIDIANQVQVRHGIEKVFSFLSVSFNETEVLRVLVYTAKVP